MTTASQLRREPQIPLTGVISVLVGAALFGTLGPLSRLAYDAGMTPGAWVAWRAGIGAIATLVYVAWRIRSGRAHLVRLSELDSKARAALLVAALMGFTLNQTMFFAFDRITVALALLGFYTYPALTAVANRILGRERLDRTRLIALALALGGMVAVIASQLDPAGGIRFDAIGLGLALGAAVSQTVFVVVSRDGYKAVPTEQAMGFVLFVTAVCAVGLALATSGTEAIGFPIREPSILPLLLTVGVFAAAIPSLLFLGGVRAIGGVRSGILMLFEPVVGVALAAWLLHESLVPIQIVGAFAILAAAVILQRAATESDQPGDERDGLALHVPGGP